MPITAQAAGFTLPPGLSDWFGSQGPYGNAINVTIVLLFVFGSVRYLRRLFTTSRAFKAAAAEMEGKSVPTGLIFPDNSAHLNELWNNFIREREGTTVSVRGAEISTVTPEDVFTEQAVLEGYNRSLAVTLAGIFTGLGILGTFIGLVQGLSGLQAAGNPSGISEGAGRLIDGMSTAFLTSIFGIVFSLLWLFLDRTLTHDVQRYVGRFFLRVKVHYPVESADQLLHRLLRVEEEEAVAIHLGNRILTGHAPLGEKHPGLPQLFEVADAQRETMQASRLVLEEQKSILQTLGTDMAVAFQNAMDSSLDKALRPALETIAATLTNYSTQVADRQADSLREMVTFFQHSLTEQLGGQFEALAGTLQSTSEWQAKVHGSLEHLLDRIEHASASQTEVLEKSTTACDLFSGSLGALGETHRQLEETSARLRTGSGAVMSMLEEMSSRIGDVAAELGVSVHAIQQQTSALEGRIAGLDAQQEVYREANTAIRVQLAEQLDSLNAQVEGLTSFWLRYKDDLGQVGEKLHSSMAEFGTFTAEKLGEVFARFDGEMAKVVEHLSGTLAELREVTEDLPSGVERLRESLKTSSLAIEGVGSSVKELSTSLNALGDLPAAVRVLSPLSEGIAQASAQVKSTEASISLLDRRMIQILGIVDGTNRPNGGTGTLAVLAEAPGPVSQ